MSPEEVQVSSGLPQGQGLWVPQTWVWHKPSGKRSPLTPAYSCQNLPRTGKQTLGGHKQNLVHQDPGERSSDPMRDRPRLAWGCPGVSRGGMGQHGWEALSACMGSFEGGCHYLHYLNHSLVSGQTGREHSPSHQQKIKDLLSMAIKARPRFPHSLSLPSECFHKPLILIHQRAERKKTTITENYSN